MKRILLTLVLTITLISAVVAVPRDMVVVEIATGTWCTFCPGAAMGADDLVENHNRAAIIENHDGDSYTNTYSNYRNSYYPMDGIPTTFFDGMNPWGGGDHNNSLYNTFRPRVINRLAVPSKYSITATGTHTETVYNLAVTISRLEADTNSNIKLHGVLTESGIQQAWQGQTRLDYVQRLMVPNQYGTDIDFSTEATQTINLTFTALPSWNAHNFEFVFFLQNDVTKEILQGCKYSIEALDNISPIGVASIDFGNANVDELYTRTLTIHNWWSQDMNIDINWDNQDYFISPQARENYVVPFLDDMSFDVYLLPSQPGNNNGTLTITTDNPAYPVITVPLIAMINGTANDDHSNLPYPNRIVSIAPNPFQTYSVIKYNLNKSDNAKLEIYNVKGAQVLSIPLAIQTPGEHSQFWSGNDNSGKQCPSGIYFCKMSVNGRTVSTQKLIKLR